MTIEQKAKAYDEAIERAKKLATDLPNGRNDRLYHVWDLENIFPELKESEDEKIVNAIRKALESKIEDLGNGVTRTACLAWLEKQGTPNQTSIWKHWKDSIAGNGGGKLIYLIKYGHTYSLSSCLCFECDYIELSELDKLMLEKQGEQKPWSEEDEKIALSIEQVMNCASLLNIVPDKIERIRTWLKTLKQRII